MSIRDDITLAAAANLELLTTLAQLDQAPTALVEIKRQVDDLQTETSQAAANLQKLHQSTLAEQADHLKYRDSIVRRLAYRVGKKKEKFDARAQKEEREYFEALQAEAREHNRQKALSMSLAEARKIQNGLEQAVNQRAEVLSNLDALHDAVFSGPTPDFPEEDAAEIAVEETQLYYQQVQEQLTLESRVDKILDKTEGPMQEAQRHMARAFTISKKPRDSQGRLYSEENTALRLAQSEVKRVEALVKKAAKLHPAVHDLSSLDVSPGNLSWETVRNNHWMVATLAKGVKNSNLQMQKWTRRLMKERRQAAQRKELLQEALTKAQEQIELSKARLQIVRLEILQRATGSNLTPNPLRTDLDLMAIPELPPLDEMPPPYTA